MPNPATDSDEMRSKAKGLLHDMMGIPRDAHDEKISEFVNCVVWSAMLGIAAINEQVSINERG